MNIICIRITITITITSITQESQSLHPRYHKIRWRIVQDMSSRSAIWRSMEIVQAIKPTLTKNLTIPKPIKANRIICFPKLFCKDRLPFARSIMASIMMKQRAIVREMPLKNAIPKMSWNRKISTYRKRKMLKTMRVIDQTVQIITWYKKIAMSWLEIILNALWISYPNIHSSQVRGCIELALSQQAAMPR